MTDSNNPHRQLVPISNEQPLVTKTSTSEVSLIGMLKAYGARRVYEEQKRKIQAQADLVDAHASLEESLARFEDIDNIIAVERKKTQAEYDALDQAERKRSELFDLELEAEKARLIADRKEHEARAMLHERTLNPPQELPAPDPIVEALETLKLYKQYQQTVDDEWQKTVEEAGGEEHVSESDRRIHELMRIKVITEIDKQLNRED